MVQKSGIDISKEYYNTPWSLLVIRPCHLQIDIPPEHLNVSILYQIR